MRCKVLLVSIAVSLVFIGQVFGQDHRVTGEVTSGESGAPLQGVNIAVQNSRLGTTTDPYGQYVLEGVSPQDILVFSYIGFQKEEVSIDGREVIDLAMTPEAVIGEDVVVIGYGTQLSRDKTGAISTLREGSFTKSANGDLQSLLQARIPGVVVTANNGDIGSEPKIRIRGGTSINASNNPIIVIDGIPINNSSGLPGGFDTGAGAGSNGTRDNPLGNLNPSDIASITVLKDAASSAIYGARGGNGVILITTKQGRPGEVSLTYSGSTSSSTIIKKLDLMSASEYLSYGKSLVALIGDRDGDGVNDYSGPVDSGATTDWQDEILRTGVSKSHNISFSAGTAKTQYRASIGYLEQQGIVLNSDRKRISARLNVKHAMLDDKLKVGLGLAPSYLTRHNTPYHQQAGYFGGVFTNVFKFNPTYPVYDTDGSYMEYPTTTIRNPVALLKETIDIGEALHVISNVTAEYQLMPGLSVRTIAGLDIESYNRHTYEPNTLPYAAAVGGRATAHNQQRLNVQFNTTVNYTTENLNLLGGYEFQEFTNSQFGAESRDFVTDAWGSNNLDGAADWATAPYSWKNQNRLISFFGRVALNLGDKINFMSTVRREGSSRFGEDNKWGLFPSAAVGVHVTDDIKVRASWGVTGNEGIGNYRSLVTLGSGANAIIGGTLLSGIAANQLANPELKWETTSDMNLGVDFGFGNITGVIDLYSKTTEDMLVEVTVPQPAVVDTKLDNVGSVENKGLEFALNAPIISTNDLRWDLGFNFTSSSNEVISLGDDVELMIIGAIGGGNLSQVYTSIILPGEPFASFYGYESFGFDDAGVEIIIDPNVAGADTLGPTGDGRKILGSPWPKFTFGISNTIYAGDLDFSFYIWSVQGNKILNNTRLEYQRPSNPTNNINLFNGTKDDVADGMDAMATVGYTDRFLEDGSFIRLQNLTLGYTLHTAQFKNLRVYVSADNLLTLTKYTGFDPEVSSIMGLAEGVDYTNYPMAKTITFGINIGL